MQTRDFVYVDDVVNGLFLALSIDCPSEINIAHGTETTLLDLRRDIEKALDAPIKIKEMPGKAGEQRRSCLSFARAKEVFNWQPQVNLEEGIKRTIAWAKGVKN